MLSMPAGWEGGLQVIAVSVAAGFSHRSIPTYTITLEMSGFTVRNRPWNVNITCNVLDIADTHFREWQRERNVLFNDTLNTFYLRLFGVRHMVKDHSDSEKGNLLPPHRLLLSINSKGSFIYTIPDRITHTTAFVTPVVEHWLEREMAQWVHPMKDRSDDPSHHEQTLYLWATSRSPPTSEKEYPLRRTASDLCTLRCNSNK